ncbi:MAG TPA: DoxX family protein [Polyangia bacterium]|nr:DoxX family protein [Polyangia bacterium]
MNAISKYGPIVARSLFGLMLFVFGLNGFLQFLPQPPMTAAAGAFAGALFQTGYMFPLIKGVEVVVGLLLLSNVLVPLALALIAPNVVNILLFHAFLAPQGLAPALVLLVFELYLAWTYRASYRSMLQVRTPLPVAQPRTETAPASASA